MIKVGVIRGGIGNQYESSLKTGERVLAVLRNDLAHLYQPVDILIARDGTWHANGIPLSKHNIGQKVDVVWNALHGDYGQDGRIQSELEDIAIPYTGSNSKASEIAVDKNSVTHTLKDSGIKIPHHVDIHWNRTEESDQVLARKAHTMSPAPWIIKPLSNHSLVGIRITKTFPELISEIHQSRDMREDVRIEEFIIGKQAHVGVVEGLRGQALYPVIPTPVEMPDNIRSQSFTSDEKKKLSDAMQTIHQILNLRHYSTATFAITPRTMTLLSVNTHPAIHHDSPFIQSLAQTGVSEKEFIAHVLSQITD